MTLERRREVVRRWIAKFGCNFGDRIHASHQTVGCTFQSEFSLPGERRKSELLLEKAVYRVVVAMEISGQRPDGYSPLRILAHEVADAFYKWDRREAVILSFMRPDPATTENPNA